MHAVSLREVLDRFGIGLAQRKAVALRLGRVYRVAQAIGHLARLVAFGSFITSKAEPQDVDVFLVMADTFDASQLTGDARLLFDHGAAQAHFGASVFWVRRRAAWPDEQAAVEFWQVSRNLSRILEERCESPRERRCHAVRPSNHCIYVGQRRS